MSVAAVLGIVLIDRLCWCRARCVHRVAIANAGEHALRRLAPGGAG